jgi:hypothetical protein
MILLNPPVDKIVGSKIVGSTIGDGSNGVGKAGPLGGAMREPTRRRRAAGHGS